jgi:hypothetical protein
MCVCVRVCGGGESKVEAPASRGCDRLQQGWGVVAVAPPSQ